MWMKAAEEGTRVSILAKCKHERSVADRAKRASECTRQNSKRAPSDRGSAPESRFLGCLSRARRALQAAARAAEAAADRSPLRRLRSRQRKSGSLAVAAVPEPSSARAGQARPDQRSCKPGWRGC